MSDHHELSSRAIRWLVRIVGFGLPAILVIGSWEAIELFFGVHDANTRFLFWMVGLVFISQLVTFFVVFFTGPSARRIAKSLTSKIDRKKAI